MGSSKKEKPEQKAAPKVSPTDGAKPNRSSKAPSVALGFVIATALFASLTYPPIGQVVEPHVTDALPWLRAARMERLAHSFVDFEVVKGAIALGIFQLVEPGGISEADVAKAVPSLDAAWLGFVLQHLVRLRLVTHDSLGRYSLTTTAREHFVVGSPSWQWDIYQLQERARANIADVLSKPRDGAAAAAQRPRPDQPDAPAAEPIAPQRAQRSNVVEVLDSNFEAALPSAGSAAVEFYAPWCGHCKKLEPIWEEVAAALLGKVTIAKCDATVNTVLAARFKVGGYPSIKFFRNREDIGTFAGQREKASIISWIREFDEPAVVPFASAEALDALVRAQRTPLVAFHLPADANYFEAKELAQAADLLRDYPVRFGRADAPALLPADNAIFVYKRDAAPTRYSGGVSLEEVKAWATELAFSEYSELGPDTFRLFVERELPIGWTFVDADAPTFDDDTREYALAAARLRSVASVTWTNASKFSRHFNGMGCVQGVLPCFVVQVARKNYRYVDKPRPTADDLVAFVHGVLNGTLKAWVKSEPIPTRNDAPVKIVVSNSFEADVMHESRGVLLEFYAPWCSHCQEFAPIYSRFAEKAAKASMAVVVAKIDAAANNVDELHPKVTEDLKGFPTVFWFPPDKSAAPEVYSGERSEMALFQFLHEKGVPLPQRGLGREL